MNDDNDADNLDEQNDECVYVNETPLKEVSQTKFLDVKWPKISKEFNEVQSF